MTKKDQKIISENPGVQPYDLLELGLSQKGYDELIKGNDSQTQAAVVEKVAKKPEALKPAVVEKAAPAKPQLSNPAIDNKSATAKVYGKTGRGKTMSRMAAERIVRKYPNEFHL